MRERIATATAAVVLAGIATAAVASDFHGPVFWSTDGLFYQARVLELRGESHDAAVKRVFTGPISATLRRFDPQRLTNRRWIAYNERFFKRRIAVPAAAAAIYPLTGQRSLLDVSLVGYVVAIVALFLLLRLRFGLIESFAVSLLTIFLPQLKGFARVPLTDSWGLALETLAFACAILTLDRGRRWLAGWIAVVLVLGFTRDSVWIPVLAAAWATWRFRTRTGALLFGTGVLSALVAVLVYPLSYLKDLAFTVNDAEPPPSTSLHFIASHYPHAVSHLVRSDVGFLRNGHWYAAAYFVVGLISLFLLGRGTRRDVAFVLLQAGAIASVLYLLALPNFSAFRLELAFVPMAAFGIALVGERLVAAGFRVAGRRPYAGAGSRVSA